MYALWCGPRLDVGRFVLDFGGGLSVKGSTEKSSAQGQRWRAFQEIEGRLEGERAEKREVVDLQRLGGMAWWWKTACERWTSVLGKLAGARGLGVEGDQRRRSWVCWQERRERDGDVGAAWRRVDIGQGVSVRPWWKAASS